MASQEAVQAVQIVEAVTKAESRIFIATPLTFFSINDQWLYVEISDDKLCHTCHANSLLEGGVYSGNHIRAFFPYLEIHDENTIEVNEHPNCRCVLTRIAKQPFEKLPIVEPPI